MIERERERERVKERESKRERESSSLCYKTFSGWILDFPKFKKLNIVGFDNVWICKHYCAILKQNYTLGRAAYCFLNGLFLLFQFSGKSRFPPKTFYNINYRRSRRMAKMTNGIKHSHVCLFLFLSSSSVCLFFKTNFNSSDHLLPLRGPTYFMWITIRRSAHTTVLFRLPRKSVICSRTFENEYFNEIYG